jgi:hypothetical protein
MSQSIGFIGSLHERTLDVNLDLSIVLGFASGMAT